MATAKVDEMSGEKLVKITIPYLHNGVHTKFICHNGRSWLAKRGEEIELPESVAIMVQQAIDAETAINKAIDEASRSVL